MKRKSLKFILIAAAFVALFIVVPTVLSAQDEGVVDPDLIWAWLEEGIIGGIGVLAAVSLLKRVLKTDGLGSIILSIVVSAVFAGGGLIKTGGFTVLKFILYTGVLALAANGIYLFPKKRSG